MEKSAKRWIRRLLSGDIGKHISPEHKSNLLEVVHEGLRNDADRVIPIFEGTAKERLAKFKASGKTPRVQRTFAGYNRGYQRDGLRSDVTEYVNAARNSPYGKALYDRLTKKRNRVEEIAGSRIIRATIDQLGLPRSPEILGVLKQYHTPNIYGITGHLASPTLSAKANEYAIQAYKNGLTEIPMPEDLIGGWQGIKADRLLVGGPGIKHTPDDIQFMRNSGSSNEARADAERLLYEATSEIGNFRPVNLFVDNNPTNRAWYGVADSVKGIDTADLVPYMRDTVFKGSTLIPDPKLYLAHRAGLLDTARSSPKYKHLEQPLARFLPDDDKFTERIFKTNPTRWYSPNPVVSGDYISSRNVIPVDASKVHQLAKKIGLRTDIDYDRLLERIKPGLTRDAQRLAKVDKAISDIPEWVKHDMRVHL